MKIVKQIKTPPAADPVLNPDFFYGNYTGIYFVTHKKLFDAIESEKGVLKYGIWF